MPVFFNGRLLVTPAVASVVDDSAMFNRNPSTGNVLAIIGQSTGGKPATALRFGSAHEARDVLIDGEALKAIEKAFDPSAQVNGPSEIVFVRVNPATQAALAIKDGSAATVINLLSTGYGRIFNQAKVKIETGTNKGKKITSQFGNDVYSQDDVYRDALSVTYTGANGTATVAVSQTQLTLTDAGATVIELSDFPTVANLVERINSVPGYAAAVIDGNGEKPTLNALDTLAATSVKNLTVTVTGVLQAIIDYLNSAAEGLLTATRQAGAGTVPANIPFTYLAGAVDGNVTNTEWQAAFDALQSVDVQWVVPLSSSSSIHAMADTHVAYMSNVARMERRAFVGGARWHDRRGGDRGGQGDQLRSHGLCASRLLRLRRQRRAHALSALHRCGDGGRCLRGHQPGHGDDQQDAESPRPRAQSAQPDGHRPADQGRRSHLREHAAGLQGREVDFDVPDQRQLQPRRDLDRRCDGLCRSHRPRCSRGPARREGFAHGAVGGDQPR
jgi:hypothetical protein